MDSIFLLLHDLDTTNSYWVTYIGGNSGNVLQYRGDLRTHDGSNPVKPPNWFQTSIKSC